MKRVLVIGSPGAGKSTFARRLREKTGLPLHYLDQLWHKADGTTISRAEFDEKLAHLLAKEDWIIDGNYSRTLERRLQACDTVFLLDLPVSTCLSGAEARIGQKREDLPWVETELDEEFRQQILQFPERELPQIYELLKQADPKTKVVVFHAREEINDYLEQL